MLDGSDGNKIDCMFFPCTQGEKVVVDEAQNIDGSIDSKEAKPAKK